MERSDLLVCVGGVIQGDVIQSLDYSKHRRSRVQSRVSGRTQNLRVWLSHMMLQTMHAYIQKEHMG